MNTEANSDLAPCPECDHTVHQVGHDKYRCTECGFAADDYCETHESYFDQKGDEYLECEQCFRDKVARDRT